MIRIQTNIQDENGNVIQGQNEAGQRRAGGGGGGTDANNVNPAPNDNAANVDDIIQDPDASNLAAAERMVEINASSIGRRIGGALLTPYILHLMGSFLFRVSKWLCILRELLGIKQHRRFIRGPQTSLYASSVGDSEGPGLWNFRYWRWLGKVVVGIWWGGARRWAELDPVW